jgi:hypothetical protein
MKKIESLTAEQEARFSEFINKWTDIGLSTRQTDKRTAEEGIIEAYAQANLKAPRIVWCTSPYAQAITRAIVLSMGKEKQDPKQLEADARESVNKSGYGQHDANWLGFYDFFNQVCGLKEETAKLTGLWKIAQSAGWFIPHEKLCWISERPVELHKDAEGRLHNETGMALRYSDGWGVYAWHGVRLGNFQLPAPDPKMPNEKGFVVDKPHLITVEHIEKEANAEIRRVMIERYGAARYITDSGAELIHEDDWGQLYKKPVKDDEDVVCVKVVNSTAEPDGTYKDYWLRVPPETKTAHEGVAWTFSMTAKEYELAQQT